MEPANGPGVATMRHAIRSVYDLTGMTLGEDKHTLLAGRLRRRVRALDLASIDEYVDMLVRDALPPEEVAAFIDAVTTHKTSFFRTRVVWDEMLRTVLPEAAERGALNAWSAACSTGEEAYSLALSCAAFDDHRGLRSWTIRATDVSPGCVEQARAGRFDREQIEALAKARPDVDPLRYFDDVGEEQVRARTDLTRRMSFGVHNLFEESSERYDVIFLRNVIIYFSEPDVLRVLDHVARSLRPNGVLVIGEAESMHGRESEFEYVSPCIYRRTE